MSSVHMDFFISAEKMLSQANGEVCYRNSISRAYYSLYHAALEHANTVSVPPLSDIRGSTHQKLSGFYTKDYKSKSSKLELVKIGTNLMRLHAKRCMADYELDEEITPADAQMHLDICKQMLQLIEKISTIPAT